MKPSSLKNIISIVSLLMAAIAAAGITVLLSLLALPNMPILSYSARLHIAFVLFAIVFCVSGLDATRRVLGIMNPVAEEGSPYRERAANRKLAAVWLAIMVVLLVIPVVLRIVSPGSLAHLYYMYSFATSSSMEENGDAFRAIEEAIQLEPSNSTYLKDAGIAYYSAGNYDKSIGYYREGMRRCGEGDYTQSGEMRFLIGKAYLRGAPDDSVSLFEEIDLEPEALHYAQWNLRESIEEADLAERRFYLAIAQYCLFLRDGSNDKLYGQALQNFDSAIAKSSEVNPQHLYWRGCLKYQKDRQAALEDFQEAASMVAYKPSYQFALGLSRLASKDYQGAYAHFKLASSLEPDNEIYRDYRENALDYAGERNWGDSDGGRTGYSQSDIDVGELGDLAVLNSCKDGFLGDERNFVRAIDVTSANNSSELDAVDVQDGQTYEIQLLVRNDNPQTTARGVEAVFSLPTRVSKSQTVVGSLSCSDAEPNNCWDSVVFNSDDFFYLEYVDGSARYWDGADVLDLPDEIVITETQVGVNGVISGENGYYGMVAIDVRAHKSIGAELQMQVRLKNGDAQAHDWAEVVDAQVGDEVEYRIEYTNLLVETVDDVMIRDVLPTNVVYKEGSTWLYSSSHPEYTRVIDDTLTTSGIDIGGYQTNGNAYIQFTGTVTDAALTQGRNQLVNWASATIHPHDGLAYVYKDDASVMCRL